MHYALSAAMYTIGLLIVMLGLLEVGRRAGARRLSKDPEGARTGIAAVDGAVFGLLGLLVAFTFGGAASRFDSRRQLIIDETNDIGTAYLRLDLLPASAQPAMRENFRRYVDNRLEVYRKLPDVAAAFKELAKGEEIQRGIWRQAVAASGAPGAAAAAPMLLLPALNAMIDITTTRTFAAQTHPPMTIFVMLFGLAMIAALLAGYGMAGSKERSWVHMVCFALVLAISIYVILDIEYPRLGLITVEGFDQALVDLRASMK
jgi:hypothetical protein